VANSTLVHHLRGGLRIVNIVEAHMVVAGRAWKPARTAQPGTFSRVPVAGRKPYWMMVARRTWFFLISSGIATGLSWLCYFRALQLGEASRVAPVVPNGSFSRLSTFQLRVFLTPTTSTIHHITSKPSKAAHLSSARRKPGIGRGRCRKIDASPRSDGQAQVRTPIIPQ
jgi:hypothetical protein